MKYLALISITLLSGCARFSVPISAPIPETTLEERALITNLASAYELANIYECPEDSKKDCALQTTKSVKYKKLDAYQILSFTDAGFTLSDLYCEKFFRSINISARKRKFSRGAVNDAGGAIAAVLGLVKAGSGVTGGTAAGFSFIDSSFRNYDESFLVDTNIAMMRRLVFSAQDNMKKRTHANPPSNIFRAESTIIRYSGLCSFLGMQDLLDSSLQDKIKNTEEDSKMLNQTKIEEIVTDNAEDIKDSNVELGPQALPEITIVEKKNENEQSGYIVPPPPPN